MDSSKLITASSDSSTKLWNVRTGECQFTFEFQEPCKAVAFSLGDEMAAISTDPFVQRWGSSITTGLEIDGRNRIIIIPYTVLHASHSCRLLGCLQIVLPGVNSHMTSGTVIAIILSELIYVSFTSFCLQAVVRRVPETDSLCQKFLLSAGRLA